MVNFISNKIVLLYNNKANQLVSVASSGMQKASINTLYHHLSYALYVFIEVSYITVKYYKLLYNTCKKYYVITKIIQLFNMLKRRWFQP